VPSILGEPVRQLSLEFKEAFTKWRYTAPHDAHAFEHRMKSTQVWALLETPTSQLRPWIRGEIGNDQTIVDDLTY